MAQLGGVSADPVGLGTDLAAVCSASRAFLSAATLARAVS